MALTLYFHPLSSFCQKALIALYENGTPFTPQKVDLMDEKENAAFKQLWPVGKFPVLRDEKNGKTIPESTSIIEYLAQHYPGPVELVPKDADAALTVRAQDRFYDLNVHLLTQKVITDRLRPAGQNDTFGVEHARGLLQTALRIVDKDMAKKTWASRRRLHDGRLCRGADLVLHQQSGDAFGRILRQCGRLSRPAGEAAVLCARA